MSMTVHTEAVAALPASHLRGSARVAAIMGTPEAKARHLVAFALLLRTDLSPDSALMFLRAAPELRTPGEIWSWVENIPQQAEQETMQ